MIYFFEILVLFIMMYYLAKFIYFFLSNLFNVIYLLFKPDEEDDIVSSYIDPESNKDLRTLKREQREQREKHNIKIKENNHPTIY